MCIEKTACFFGHRKIDLTDELMIALYKKIENLITKDFLNDNPIGEEDNLLVASANEMTGLIPAGPQDKEEVKNYEKVYPYLPPQK